MEYEVIRSSRKTIAIQTRHDGKIVVRCPKAMTNQKIEAFMKAKQEWIRLHMPKEAPSPPFSEEELRAMTDYVAASVPPRVAVYAKLINKDYGEIKVRRNRSRWGSCSSKGNLSFSCLLAMVPPEVLDYVVVHEVCHLKEMNHSPAFWENVANLCPDYQNSHRWLKENGVMLIRRM